MLTNLQHVWDSFPVFRSMRSELRKGASTVRLPHVPLGFGAFVVAGLQQVTRRPIVCITPDSRSAEHWQRNLRSWLGNDVDLLPELDIVPYRVMARSQEIRAERVRVLYRMSRGQTQVVVAPVGALLRLLPPRTLFDNNVVHLRVGERIERDELLQRLFWLGYERVDTVRLPGQ